MNKTAKILGMIAVIGGGVFGLKRLFQTGNTGKKISVNIANVDKPKTKSGALILSVNVSVDNPTSHTLNLKKPYITVFYNGKEVGNSIPSDEHIDIKANDRSTIKGINIQIPFVKLGTMALSLISGKTPDMAFDISVKTEADGIPYTDQQHFKL